MDRISETTKHGYSSKTAEEKTSAALDEYVEIACKLAEIHDLPSLYSTVAGIIVGKFRASHIALFLYHPESCALKLAYSHGLDLSGNELFSIDGAKLSAAIESNTAFPSYLLLNTSAFNPSHQSSMLDQFSFDLGIPLDISSEMPGVLSVGQPNGSRFSEDESAMLMRLARQFSICIHNCLCNEEDEREKTKLNETLSNLSILYSIGQAMTYISDLKSLLTFILDRAIAISRAEKGSIMLYDQANKELSVRILAGMKDRSLQERINNNEVRCKSFKPGEGIAGKVFETGKPICLNEARKAAAFVNPEDSFTDSIACIPMVVYGEALGVINLTNKLDDLGFTEQDIELLKAVADQAAIAVNKAQLWDMAFTDALTGLHDRRYFKVKLHEELQRAKRYHRPFSIIMADLDRFKNVNDTYGHSEGDRVLKSVGDILRRQIRNVDIIARYGGDEFVMFVPEKDKRQAMQLAERLRTRVAQEHFSDEMTVSLSMGIASYPLDSIDLEDLVDKADRAMYQAKQKGRNCIEPY